MHLVLPEILAELTHINVREEKHGDEDVLANDLSISVVLPAHETLQQLCVGDSQKLIDAFWTEDGKSREPTISSIKLTHKLKDHVLRLSVGIDDMITFDDVTLKKFSWTPENGHTLTLKFKAAILPDENEMAHIATGLNKHIQIAIDPPRQMDIEEVTEPEEEVTVTKRRKRKQAA